METLGDRIRMIRLNKGMNKTDFGKLFSATGSLVNKWENHDVSPSEDRIKKMAKLGNYNIDELIYGNPDVEISVDDYLIKKLSEYTNNKADFLKEDTQLVLKNGIEELIDTVGTENNLGKDAIIDNKKYHKQIETLKIFGEEYINKNYQNYDYNQYMKDFSHSNPEDFQLYKEQAWKILFKILESYWESFKISIVPYDWINHRFTDQIKEELYIISNKAVEDNKENYYVNELVQPFLDKAAKEFKEYIKDNI